VGRGHVFVSHDAGRHFSDMSVNLPDVPANAIAVRGDRLYVGTDVGVFTAPKAGGAWTRLGTGLPNVAVWDLNFNPQDTKMVVATHGRGVWTYDFGARAALGSSKSPPKVLGRHSEHPAKLPATGGEATAGLGIALLAGSVLIGRRARRNSA
jgi:hypothetical protein